MTRTLLALSAAALAACGVTVKAGEVTDLYVSAAYTWFMPISTCSGGQYPVCTTNLIPIYEPERYVVTVTNCDLREEGDDLCPSTRWNVDPDVYADLLIGDHFVAEEE